MNEFEFIHGIPWIEFEYPEKFTAGQTEKAWIMRKLLHFNFTLIFFFNQQSCNDSNDWPRCSFKVYIPYGTMVSVWYSIMV